MGVSKDYQRRVQDAGAIELVQSLTEASTATRIPAFGITVITNSSGDNGYILESPRAGLRKTILVDTNSTGAPSVYMYSTGTLFLGSTANAMTFSTGTGQKAIELVGTGTATWGIVTRTTGITLAGSTISG